MKKRIRKTGEIVDVITYYNLLGPERNDTDTVSYVDSKGEEHHKEKGLNLSWDFEDVEEVLSTNIDREQMRKEVQGIYKRTGQRMDSVLKSRTWERQGCFRRQPRRTGKTARFRRARRTGTPCRDV